MVPYHSPLERHSPPLRRSQPCQHPAPHPVRGPASGRSTGKEQPDQRSRREEKQAGHGALPLAPRKALTSSSPQPANIEKQSQREGRKGTGHGALPLTPPPLRHLPLTPTPDRKALTSSPPRPAKPAASLKRCVVACTGQKIRAEAAKSAIHHRTGKKAEHGANAHPLKHPQDPRRKSLTPSGPEPVGSSKRPGGDVTGTRFGTIEGGEVTPPSSGE